MRDINKEITWKANAKHLGLVTILALLLVFFEYLRDGEFLLANFFIVFYYTFFCWFGSLYLSVISIKLFNSIDQTPIRIGINILLVLGFIYLVVLFAHSTFEKHNSVGLLDDFITCSAITMLISLFYMSRDYFVLYKNKVQETEELKRIQIEKDLKILSSQINPHFIFNSLNTLMAIIPEDTSKALRFTECFSKVYRYALQKKDFETVPLQDEIDLIRDYAYLLQIRFGGSFVLDIDINEDYYKALIPPFVLQMLVENATNHNTVSKSEPLEIEILVKEESLIVRNNINEKVQPNPGTGTGLKNISQRIKLLTGNEVEIVKDRESYTVFVPIIFAEDYEGDHR